jgi:hypothetical protein
MTAPRYIIVQEGERFIIVNPADNSLCWYGSHWFFRGESGPPLTTFDSYEAARKYAHIVLGGDEHE